MAINRFRWQYGIVTPLNPANLNNIEQAISLANKYEGEDILTTWTDGLPVQKRHYDTIGGNIIKQIDTTWTDGLPVEKEYNLYDYSGGVLVATTTFTITTTWTDGLPVRKVIS